MKPWLKPSETLYFNLVQIVLLLSRSQCHNLRELDSLYPTSHTSCYVQALYKSERYCLSILLWFYLLAIKDWMDQKNSCILCCIFQLYGTTCKLSNKPDRIFYPLAFLQFIYIAELANRPNKIFHPLALSQLALCGIPNRSN